MLGRYKVENDRFQMKVADVLLEKVDVTPAWNSRNSKKFYISMGTIKKNLLNWIYNNGSLPLLGKCLEFKVIKRY